MSTEVARLLQELIRLDTANPPGNETVAAELLRDYLEAAGVDCALYARVPDRANLVARIRGRGDGPSLALLSHTDVVPADPQEWQREPFGGELVDGEVWGRGALDMKGEVAASAVALATLAREGWRGSGDLIFVAAADEEVGDGFGLEWLVEAHPDAVRADFSVNEGGRRPRRARRQGALPVRDGGEDERSVPPARPRPERPRVDALDRRQRARQGRPADHEARRASRSSRSSFRRWRASSRRCSARSRLRPTRSRLRERCSPLAGELVEPLLGLTVSPTKAHASDEAQRHSRRLRGHARRPAPAGADTRGCRGGAPRVARPRRLRARQHRGTGRDTVCDRRSALGCRRVVRRGEEPGAAAAPICVAGFTDSHWLREAFGTVAYGFFPARALDFETAARLIHSADERVPVADLDLGVRFLRHAAQTVCA